MSMAEPTRGTARTEAFSDGVIAIIITIMVLELKLPETAAKGTFTTGFLLPLAPKLASYALSFVIVGVMWVNHHLLLDLARRPTPGLMWWNLHLLFWMSLIPFATGFLGEHPTLPRAVALYGGIQTLASLSFSLLRLHILRANSDGKPLNSLQRASIAKSLIAGLCYLTGTALAYVSVYLTLAVVSLVPVVFGLPLLGLTRAQGEQRP